MIEAVFWDFGGVFTGSPFYLDDYARSLSTTNDRLLEHVFGRYEANGDHPWHRLERGEGTLAEALEAADESCRADGIEEFTFEGFFKAMSGTTSEERRDQAVAKVRELNEAGIRQAIITNNAGETDDSQFSEGIATHVGYEDVAPMLTNVRYEGNPDPRPMLGSPALEAGAGSSPPSDGALDTSADFVGAFGTVNWLEEWTFFGDEADYEIETTTTTTTTTGQ